MGRVAPHTAADEMESHILEDWGQTWTYNPPSQAGSRLLRSSMHQLMWPLIVTFGATSRDEDLFTAAPHPSAQQPMMACTRTS